ncbi:chorismate synthase [Mesosutterella sp. OilRF-GAM-744-9]|uniref:Chorismate synthase n=1 Tax=Mesosutterella porci TaxID=2915351 RepID=A0ABS9MQ67_9BURK|nr:chorismate synthase [Mesosutterella sp. oilRF-744-WT-GAM-9]MCG5030405.1 chorismate synthase [Mesosutterella sp. oilRF-744-WT-GAM-9]
MSGSSMGRIFTVTNFGESHGPAIGCVVDGVPAGLALEASDIQQELDRRRPGTSRFVTQRREADAVEILSGLYEGRTTGSPVALLIRNTDQKSRDYSAIADKFRPGHADYGYFTKYGLRDPRGGGRSSARLTAPTVAAGAIAKKWLAREFGTVVRACVTQVGPVRFPVEDWAQTGANPFFAATAREEPLRQAGELLDQLRRESDSIGARLRLEALNVPAGLGEPVYDRLDARLACALMGLNAVKAVSIGEGFGVCGMRGSENNDEMTSGGFLTNHAGGILGGISTGEPVVAELGIKPTPSIRRQQRTRDEAGSEVLISTTGRHDPCVGLRAAPVAEALAAAVLMDFALLARCAR